MIPISQAGDRWVDVSCHFVIAVSKNDVGGPAISSFFLVTANWSLK